MSYILETNKMKYFLKGEISKYAYISKFAYIFAKGNTGRMNQKTMKLVAYKMCVCWGSGVTTWNKLRKHPCRVYLFMQFNTERSEETALRGSYCPNTGQLGQQN